MNACIPHNSDVEILVPEVIELGPLEGDWVMNGIIALLKEYPGNLLTLSAMWAYSEKMAIYEEADPHQTPNLLASWSRTSRALELLEINFSCS